jgi:hypothetical protein
VENEGEEEEEERSPERGEEVPGNNNEELEAAFAVIGPLVLKLAPTPLVHNFDRPPAQMQHLWRRLLQACESAHAPVTAARLTTVNVLFDAIDVMLSALSSFGAVPGLVGTWPKPRNQQHVIHPVGNQGKYQRRSSCSSCCSTAARR